MINFLKNIEIDRDKWDSCIKNSAQARPYAFSWYLDIMAPGWEALVEDDYDSVCPLPSFKKFGIRYIATPIFLQQLGAYSPDRPDNSAINEFLDYLPEYYRLIDLNIGQRIDNDAFRVTLKSNYELKLSKPYEKLIADYTPHCKRNVEKSNRKKPELVQDITPAELIDLFINNRGTDIKGIKKRDYQKLSNLMNFCLGNNKGRILGVRSAKGRIVYGIFLVETKGRKIMLFVVNTHESRESRLGYYVVNELIKESASTRTILDFSGSSIPSIASFMESFGSINVPFYRIYRNRLPWPLKMLK